MTGFRGRSGRSFRARLALMQTPEGKWRVEFDEPWAREGAKPPEAEAEPSSRGGRRAKRRARAGAALDARGLRGAPPVRVPSPRCATMDALALTLVTGPANSAKAQIVLERYRAALARGPILVVPRAADVEHYRRELAARGRGARVAVEPFGGLMREIARRAGVAAGAIGERRARAAPGGRHRRDAARAAGAGARRRGSRARWPR